MLAAVMCTAAVLTPFRVRCSIVLRAKPILIIGNLASALGYAGFAFVDRPWQAIFCSAVGGARFGVANTANQVLSWPWSQRSSAPPRLRSAESQATSVSAAAPRCELHRRFRR